MRSAVTPDQLVLMLVLLVQAFILWYVAAPFWQRRRSRVGVAVCRIVAILCGTSAGMVLFALAQYGMTP